MGSTPRLFTGRYLSHLTNFCLSDCHQIPTLRGHEQVEFQARIGHSASLAVCVPHHPIIYLACLEHESAPKPSISCFVLVRAGNQDASNAAYRSAAWSDMVR